MSETTYRICMSVPLAKRNVTMLLHRTAESIDGWLDVLGKQNTLFGVISSDGQVTLPGVLQTLYSTVPYTGAVSSAAAGTKTLKLNMDTLYANTGTLRVSVGELNNAVEELYGGTQKLADGTTEFVGKTADIDMQISDEIDSMTSAITGDDTKTVSFVSEQNTNVKSVQFVIKTAAIEKAAAAADTATEEAPLTFWQKLLRLFGLY